MSTYVSDTRKEDIENDIITAEYYTGNKGTNKAFTIEERLKTWNVAGVSIAVIKDFEIEWADGYGHARPDLSIVCLAFLLKLFSIKSKSVWN